MPWNIKLNDEKKIVELAYFGVVSADDLNKALAAALKLSKENEIKLFLADCSQMIGGHSVTDLYYLATIYEASGFTRDMKEALLMPAMQSTHEQVKFYETTCLNNGFNVRIFNEVGEAINWLTS